MASNTSNLFTFDAPEMMPMMNMAQESNPTSSNSPSIETPRSPSPWSPSLFLCANTVFAESDPDHDAPGFSMSLYDLMTPCMNDYDFFVQPDQSQSLHQLHQYGHDLHDTLSPIPSTFSLFPPPTPDTDPFASSTHSSPSLCISDLVKDSELYPSQSPHSSQASSTSASSSPTAIAEIDIDLTLPAPPVNVPAQKFVQPRPLSPRALHVAKHPDKFREMSRRRRADVLQYQKPPKGGYLYSCQFLSCEALKPMKLSAWKQHQLVHTGGRPHQCEFCGSRFPKLFNLNRHKRTCKERKAHTANQPTDANVTSPGNVMT